MKKPFLPLILLSATLISCSISSDKISKRALEKQKQANIEAKLKVKKTKNIKSISLSTPPKKKLRSDIKK